MPNRIKLLVKVSGGVVRGVYCDQPIEVDVEMLDLDELYGVTIEEQDAFIEDHTASVVLPVEWATREAGDPVLDLSPRDVQVNRVVYPHQIYG